MIHSVLGTRVISEVVTKWPMASGAAIMGLKATAADVLVQTVVEKRDRIEPERVFAFAAFGTVYQGVIQYLLYLMVIERIFPGRSFRKVVSKVISANLVTDPLFFFPLFYIFKETIARHGVNGEIIKSALSRYRENCLVDWRNSWVIWIPGHIISFAFVPTQWRIPFMAAVSFGYVCWLSATRGEMNKKRR